MKNRKQIIDECVSAATACFQHYSNHKLSSAAHIRVWKALNETLPDQIETSKWQEYANEYAAYVAAEEETE